MKIGENYFMRWQKCNKIKCHWMHIFGQHTFLLQLFDTVVLTTCMCYYWHGHTWLNFSDTFGYWTDTMAIMRCKGVETSLIQNDKVAVQLALIHVPMQFVVRNKNCFMNVNGFHAFSTTEFDIFLIAYLTKHFLCVFLAIYSQRYFSLSRDSIHEVQSSIQSVHL